MTPFRRVPLDPKLSDPAAYMHTFGVGYQEALRMVETKRAEEHYENDVYLVDKSPLIHTYQDRWPPMIHLTITRKDHAPVHSWADFQQIKNALVGPEHEAIEVYPAESRLVDMAHQYHLWVFASRLYQVPIGWTSRMVRTD